VTPLPTDKASIAAATPSSAAAPVMTRDVDKNMKILLATEPNQRRNKLPQLD